MNAKTRRMIKQIERSGGLAGFGDGVPDEVAERFLEQIMHDCPDCRAALARPAIDDLLERDDLSEKLGHH